MPLSVNNQHAVNRLRQITEAASDDVFNGVTYWTDEQLYAILAQYSYVVFDVSLSYAGGSYVYRVPVPNHVWYETGFNVTDGGVSVVTTLEYDQRLITSAAKLANPLIDKLVVFDMNGAAAEVWGQKAAQRFDYVDWRAGSHNVRSRQEYDNCVQRQKMYRARRIRRFDLKA